MGKRAFWDTGVVSGAVRGPPAWKCQGRGMNADPSPTAMVDGEGEGECMPSLPWS